MSAIFSIKEDSAGLWRISRDHHDLACRLRLEQAIKQANRLSHNERSATGQETIVEVHGPDFAITLTHLPASR